MSALSVTCHKHEDQWVIRLNGPGGFAGLGTANGQEEAAMMVAVLQGAIELHYQDSQHTRYELIPSPNWVNGMRNASNIVEGRLLVKYAEDVGLIPKGGA